MKRAYAPCGGLRPNKAMQTDGRFAVASDRQTR